MKRLLLGCSREWKENLNTQVLYPKKLEDIKQCWGENGSVFYNAGNLLFMSAMHQFLTQSKGDYDVFGPDTDVSAYEKIVVPEANLFSINNVDIMLHHAKDYRLYNRPVYIVGVGLQAGLGESVKELANKIEKPVYEYVDSIYKSGGELGLRGYHTKELLDIIYPNNTATVIGCPSLYVNGRNLSVSNNKVDRKNFSYTINGKAIDMATGFFKSNSVRYPHMYIDQEEFGDVLCRDWNEADPETINRLIAKYSIEGLRELFSGQVKLFFDVPLWKKEMKKYAFTFGRRIHGNIISILAGVPALLNNQDKRTEEIADFFDIPMTHFRYDKEFDIYDLYLKTDYSKFNRSFKEKYDLFEDFLRRCDLIDNLGDSQEYEKIMVKNGPWEEIVYDLQAIKQMFEREKGI